MQRLVEQVEGLFGARGDHVERSGNTLIVQQPPPANKKTTLLVGRAQDITEKHVHQAWPDQVVIEDDAPRASFERVQALCAQFSEPRLVNFSRFVDDVWQASRVVEKAMSRAEAEADAGLPPAMQRAWRPDPQKEYVDQRLVIDEVSHLAINACDDWLGGPPEMLGVLARAGLGKSELTRVLQWRTGLKYQNASETDVPRGLPPIGLRVELRELRELSIRAIAEHFRDSWGEKLLGDEDVLAHLARSGRLVIILDGLDELQLTREAIAAGLRQLADNVKLGARLMITSRPGYYGREGPLVGALEGCGKVAHLGTLAKPDAIELVRRTDSSIDQSEAERLVTSLPEHLQGVPLFLIWKARSRGYTDADTEAQGLLDLVYAFCERDEQRVQLPGADQIAFLKDLAYEIALTESDSLLRDDAKYLVGAEASPFLDAPHALLHFPDLDNHRIGFLDKTYESLFLAERMREIWNLMREQGRLREWLRDFLNRRTLDALTIEYLSQLVENARISEAWQQSKQLPLARRNLLAIGLEKVRLRMPGDDPRGRAKELESLLGSRNLSGTRLYDLTIERYDFADWDLSNVDPEGSYIAFNHFESAQVDEVLRQREFVQSGNTGLEAEQEEFGGGRQRLLEIVEAFRNRRVSSYSLHNRLADHTAGLDKDGLAQLRRLGLIDNRQGEGGSQFWVLEPSGRDLFRALLRDPNYTDQMVSQAVKRLD